MSTDLSARASEWLLRLQGDNVSQSDVAEWLEWCNADPKNLEAFDRAQSLYDGLRAVEEDKRAEFIALADLSLHSLPRERGRVREGALKFTLPAALAASLAALLFWAPWHSSTPIDHNNYAAPRGINRDITLADQSTVVLGGASTVTSQYTGDTRHLSLETGEAFFTVKHERNRPFIVKAGPITVTALGTAFNIRRTAGRIVVVVTEGVVEVKNESQKPVRVQTGQQAVQTSTTTGLMVSNTDTASATAWQAGRLQYTAEPLGSVLDDVNRYVTHRVVIEDPAVRDLIFTGTVFRGQVDEWVLALDTVFPVRIDRAADGTIALHFR